MNVFSLSLKIAIFIFIFLFVSGGLKSQNVGIGTTDPKAALHVVGNSIVFIKQSPDILPEPPPPVSGAGVRMMWYGDKYAFRFGGVTGNQWDGDNVGTFSFAGGRNPEASGTFAFSFGDNTRSSGPGSVSFGSNCEATGQWSIAAGFTNRAIGNFSLALGASTTAMGRYSSTFGLETETNAFGSTVVGVFNDNNLTGDPINNQLSNPLFVVGNGTSNTNRSNAFNVFRNGNVGIGTNAPTARLHIVNGALLAFTPGLVGSNPPPPPVSGAGRRMMWYPEKAAFRSGFVFGVQWDLNSIGDYSFAAGFNLIASGNSSIALGRTTEAAGRSSVTIGDSLIARGDYATALGYRVWVNGKGSIAFGDSDPHNKGFSQTVSPNIFWARYNGGFYLISSNAGNQIGVQVTAGSNSWSAISDAKLKENFLPVNGEQVLKNIAAMPQYTWNYKGQDPKSFRHYGPMAQDFFKAFGNDDIGTIGCDTLINQHDFLGVSLVAIQALEKRTAELIQELKDTREALRILEKKHAALQIMIEQKQ